MDTAAVGASRLVESLTGVSSDFQFKVLLSALVVLAVMVVRRLVLGVVFQRVDQPRVRYRWGKLSGYVATLVALLLIINIWIEGIPSLGTFIGLLTAGLAIALKDLVANVAGWLFIMWRRPFDLGDRIQIAGHSGDVVDLRIFQFTLLEIGNWVDADQSTGRIIHVPNLKVFSEPTANYTAQFAFLWHEVPVLLTFESDWRKAKSILEEIVNEAVGDVPQQAERAMRDASRTLLIFYQKFTPIVYTTVKDSGVLLTVRYLCNPRHRRGTTQALWEGILEAFARHPDIDLAYPTQRLYVNPLEGKPDARAPLPWLAGEDAMSVPRGDGEGR
ncbi:MAG: mechanosensitive ion channel family protein [Gemmatimonadetes bacterium]|nr:mechanosensitive ion channel family protein [Gemmatimonadota bacterium]